MKNKWTSQALEMLYFYANNLQNLYRNVIRSTTYTEGGTSTSQTSEPSILLSLLTHVTHLGNGYLGPFVDELHHMISLALVRGYEETLREGSHRWCIQLAHELGKDLGRGELLGSETGMSPSALGWEERGTIDVQLLEGSNPQACRETGNGTTVITAAIVLQSKADVTRHWREGGCQCYISWIVIEWVISYMY